MPPPLGRVLASKSAQGSRMHDEADTEEDRYTRKENRQNDRDGWSSRHFFSHSSADRSTLLVGQVSFRGGAVTSFLRQCRSISYSLAFAPGWHTHGVAPPFARQGENALVRSRRGEFHVFFWGSFPMNENHDSIFGAFRDSESRSPPQRKKIHSRLRRGEGLSSSL
jgi:hypothetical protein